MRGMIRVGVVAAAALGSTAFLGTQVAGAAKPASNLGVYEAVGAPVSSMSVEFTVPHYTCTAPNEWVSAYADTFDSANGGESAFDAGYVQLSCNSAKQAVIYPVLEIDGTYSDPTLKIKKGNLMQVSITCGASGSVATLTDETTGDAATASSPNSAECESAYMGNIAVANKHGKDLPLPAFGTFDFSAANVNDNAFGALSPTAVNYKEGADVIKVGALTDGTSWVNTEKS